MANGGVPVFQKCREGMHWDFRLGRCVEDAPAPILPGPPLPGNPSCVTKYPITSTDPNRVIPLPPGGLLNTDKPCSRKATDFSTNPCTGQPDCPAGWHSYWCESLIHPGTVSFETPMCTKDTGPAPPPPPIDPPDPDEQGCCTEGELCDGLNESLSTIAETLRKMGEIIEGKFGSGDCSSDECLEEIERIVKEKIEEEFKAFASCQRKVEAGLCGTLEYEQECGRFALECAEKECSMSAGGYEGKPCLGCGIEPCCCYQGNCVPCGEEPTEEKPYRGWCSALTGIVVVTQGDEPGPGPGYVPVSIADTELVAFEQARQFCKQGPQSPGPPKPVLDMNPASTSFYCDLMSLASGAAARSMGDQADRMFQSEGAARIINAVSDIGIAGMTASDLGSIAQGVLTAVLGIPPKFLEKSVGYITSLLGCQDQGFKNAAHALSAFGLHHKITGVDLSEFTTSYKYALHAACQNRFLNPDQAMAAHLARSVEYPELAAYWRIHGYCDKEVDKVLEASRSKPVPMELGAMQLRGIISETEYYSGMRRLGYTNQADSYNLLKLRQQLPTLSEIIRYMVRDADDKGTVDRFDLDYGFGDKYQEQLKEWSEQQGVPELVARYSWRSHWTIPSPTQLFQFWRRLRKDNKFGGEAKLWDDIKTALVQQDILPFWHKHFEAVSYVPLGRIDIRRAFNIGSLKEEDLEELYNQLGYSDADAKKQRDFSIRLRNESIGRNPVVKLWVDFLLTRQEAEQRLSNLGFPDDAVRDALEIAQYGFDSSSVAVAYSRGLIDEQRFIDVLTGAGVSNHAAGAISNKLRYKVTNHPAVKEYQAGMIDRIAADTAMVTFGMDATIIKGLLDAADSSEKFLSVIACQRSIKRRYVTGDLDKIEAENALVRSGTNQVRAQKMIDNWACELGSKGKVGSIPTLCNWLERGVIAPGEFLRRMDKLGYDPDDAARIMDDCLISISVKRAAEAKREAKEQAAEDAREQRLREKQLAAVNRAAGQLLRAQKQRQATIERREKQLLSAMEKIVRKCDCPLSQASAFAKDAIARIPTDYGLNKDESLQVLLSSVDSWDGDSFDVLTGLIDVAAELLQTAALANGEASTLPLGMTNGHTQPS